MWLIVVNYGLEINLSFFFKWLDESLRDNVSFYVCFPSSHPLGCVCQPDMNIMHMGAAVGATNKGKAEVDGSNMENK